MKSSGTWPTTCGSFRPRERQLLKAAGLLAPLAAISAVESRYENAFEEAGKVEQDFSSTACFPNNLNRSFMFFFSEREVS